MGGQALAGPDSSPRSAKERVCDFGTFIPQNPVAAMLPEPPETENTSIPTDAGRPTGFLIAAILAGLISAITIAGLVTIPEPSTPSNQLAVFNSNKAATAFSDLWVLVFALGVTPFATYLGGALKSQSRGLVWASMLVFLFGAFVLAVSNAASYSALNAISTTTAPSSATAAYEAALWYNITDGWEVLGFSALGLGVSLFSVAFWNSRVFPNWMAIVGFIGGTVGFIGGAATAWIFTGNSIPRFVFPLILGSLVVIIIWGFACPFAVGRAQPKT